MALVHEDYKHATAKRIGRLGFCNWLINIEIEFTLRYIYKYLKYGMEMICG
jgi:hypothetical protein